MPWTEDSITLPRRWICLRRFDSLDRDLQVSKLIIAGFDPKADWFQNQTQDVCVDGPKSLSLFNEKCRAEFPFRNL